MREEFYYNMRFPADDKGLKPIWVVPSLGGRKPDGNVVAWAMQRSKEQGGGRGFCTSCGHFYDNWKNDAFRKTVLNGIVWSAGVEVPEKGVEAAFIPREELKE
jgi:type 1 glutamine amidotransferase